MNLQGLSTGHGVVCAIEQPACVLPIPDVPPPTKKPKPSNLQYLHTLGN